MMNSIPRGGHALLVIEIKSASVHASVIVERITKNSKQNSLETISSIGLSLNDYSKHGTQRLENIGKLLRETRNHVIKDFNLFKESDKNFKGKIDEAHIVLSSPWIISQARNISAKFKKPISITPKMIDKIINDHIITPDTPITKDVPMSIVDRRVIRVALNGYQMQDWIGRKTTNIDITCLISATTASMTRMIGDHLDHYVKPKNIYYHSAVVLQAGEFKNHVPEDVAYSCVDIHEDMTDMMVVGKNGQISFGSFPIGYQTITSRVAKSLKVPKYQAKSLMSLHGEGNLDPIHASRHIRIMNTILSSWHDHLSHIMETVNEPKSIIKIAIKSDLFHSLFGQVIMGKNGHKNIHFIKNHNYAKILRRHS